MSTSLFEFTSRARPIVEVGQGASSTAASTGARWDVSLWDDAGFAEWAGAEPTWTDASEFVISSDTTGGRFGRITDQFDVGRAVILFDNYTGWADPDAVPDDLQPALTLGQQIRVGVVHDVYGIVWRWRGFIDDIEPVWSAEDDPLVAVRAIDSLGEAGRAGLARTVAEADDEGTTVRVTEILDAAPWITAKRLLDDVDTGLVEATLDGKVVDLLRRSADSAAAWVFGDTDGNIVLRSAAWLNNEASRAAEFVITNDDALDAPAKVCPSRWARPNRRSDMTGRVILQNTIGDDPYIDESSTVVDDYGAETYSVRDLWTKSPTDMATIGDRILLTRSPETLPRIESVVVYGNAAGDNTNAVDLLTLVDIARPTRVRCRHVNDDGDALFDDQCFVVGIRERIARDEWSMEISLDRSDPFAIPMGPFEWDVAEWDQAQWN